MAKEKIAVIGGGLMGAGIALTFAAKGHDVAVCEPSGEVRATISQRVAEGLAAIGAATDSAAKVTVFPTLGEAVRDSTIVFEAAPEKLDLKRAIFRELERETAAHCTLASNTSVIPIGDIAAPLDDRSRVIGTHWWNPPHLIPLVEVVATPDSAPERIDRMVSLLESAGKKPVRVLKDVPGFVGNRLQHALWREAQALVSEGVCDAETVDTVVKNSFGLRLAVLGPIENADLVGLDLTLDIHKTVIPGLSVMPGPNPLLERLVAEGKLGFKTRQGFRSWTDEQIAEVRRSLVEHLRRAVQGGSGKPPAS